MRRVLLLLVDGLRPDLAEQWLAEGHLPHLARLTSPDTRRRGITAFPSTTSVAYLPFLTGCLPGRANIPSIRWLDRSRYEGRWWKDRHAVRSYCGVQSGLLDGDITPEVRTLFQLVPESYGLFTPIARGLSAERDPARLGRKLWGALGHYLQWHQPSDDVVGRHLLDLVDQPWRFLFAQFPAVDGYTHQCGPDHPRVRAALTEVDRVIGKVVDRMAARGTLEDTLVLLVSDHGATPMHTHMDLACWFRERGVRTLAHPVLWERNPAVAVAVAGNASAMLYARPNESRTGRLPLSALQNRAMFGHADDLVGTLAAEPSVAFLAGPDDTPGALRIVGGEGGREEARLSRRNGTIRYEPLTGDPLQVGDVREASAAEWLLSTWDGPFPDAAVQLLSLFESPRTGDVVLAAADGHDFRQRFEVPEHRAGHGSFLRSHMQIPVWANRHLPEATMRSVDLFPAMLHWLGEPVPTGIDGAPVWRP